MHVAHEKEPTISKSTQLKPGPSLGCCARSLLPLHEPPQPFRSPLVCSHPPTLPSFGRVYLANWRGVFVACKVLLMGGAGAADPQRALTLSSPVLSKLEEEAGLLASLRHPNIVSGGWGMGHGAIWGVARSRVGSGKLPFCRHRLVGDESAVPTIVRQLLTAFCHGSGIQQWPMDTLRAHVPPNAVAAAVPGPRQVNFFGICHDPPCIVTEYAVYGSLSELLARARTEPAVVEALTWQRRLAMVRQGGAGRGGSGGRPPSGVWVRGAST